MGKVKNKANIGDTIRVTLRDHQQCPVGVVDALGINNSGRLVYIVICGCGEKLRLTSTQLERPDRKEGET